MDVKTCCLNWPHSLNLLCQANKQVFTGEIPAKCEFQKNARGLKGKQDSVTLYWEEKRQIVYSLSCHAQNVHVHFLTHSLPSALHDDTHCHRQREYYIMQGESKQESCAIAKTSARCTIRQYAHGLKLESPFVP